MKGQCSELYDYKLAAVHLAQTTTKIMNAVWSVSESQMALWYSNRCSITAMSHDTQPGTPIDADYKTTCALAHIHTYTHMSVHTYIRTYNVSPRHSYTMYVYNIRTSIQLWTQRGSYVWQDIPTFPCMQQFYLKHAAYTRTKHSLTMNYGLGQFWSESQSFL